MLTQDQANELVFPKCKAFRPDKRHLLPELVLVEEKLDGESLMLARGQAFGRRLSDVNGWRLNKWDTLPPWIQRLATDDELVHGELYVVGGTSSDVKTALKEGREQDWLGPLCTRLRFVAHRFAFDTTDPDPMVVREALVDKGFLVPELLFCRADTKQPNAWWRPDELDVAALNLEAERRKIEGWMLKGSGAAWKVKRESTCDLIVTGTKEGNGKYLGLVGALKCSAHAVCFDCGGFGELRSETEDVCTPCPECEGKGTVLVEVANVSGMTDDVREQLSFPDAGDPPLLGRVCEVEYNLVAAQGRLRHPRFKRWRDDKPAAECTADQLEAT